MALPTGISHVETLPGVEEYIAERAATAPTGTTTRPTARKPETWLGRRMWEIKRRAKLEWERKGEIEPWSYYLESRYPEVAAYGARRAYKRAGVETPWGQWFYEHYESLAKQFGWTEPVEKQWGLGTLAGAPARAKIAAGRWSEWFAGAPKYSRAITTLGY